MRKKDFVRTVVCHHFYYISGALVTYREFEAKLASGSIRVVDVLERPVDDHLIYFHHYSAPAHEKVR